jgi:hypothetical protein
MLERWKALCWEKKVVYGGFVILGFLILGGIASQALALDLNGARAVREEGLAGTTPELVYYADVDSTNAMRMPTAYLIWEKVGNPIEIRRFYNNVAESYWIAIPDGQSFVVPAPPMFKRTGSTAWWHKLAFKGAASDTVKYLPMDR